MSDFSLNKSVKELSAWDFYSLVGLFLVFLYQIFQWHKLPLFMDCYYHLSVARGFYEAGGWTGIDFWQNAPFGRPHLYPPLFHLFELMAYEAGLPFIVIAKLSQFFIYPFFLCTAWFIVRKLFSGRLAFIFVFLLASSLMLYFSLLTLLPFVLAFIFGLWAFYFFETGRTKASWAFFVFSLYAHQLIGILLWGALLGSLLERREGLKKFFIVSGGVFLACAPFLWHQFRHLSFLNSGRALEFYFVHINLLLFFLAVPGLFIALKMRKRASFFVYLCLSMGLLALVYRNRFFSGPGIVPFFFLAALSIDRIWAYWTQQKKKVFWAFFSLACAGFLFYGASPYMELNPLKEKPSFLWVSRIPLSGDSAPGEGVFRREDSFYNAQIIGESVDLIRRYTGPGDLLWSNFNYAGGMLAVLSRRSQTDAMLHEVSPFKETDEISSARMIVWFRDRSDAEALERAAELAKERNLRLIGENEIALFYMNDFAIDFERPIRAVLPKSLCFSLIGSLFGVVLLDLLFQQKI